MSLSPEFLNYIQKMYSAENPFLRACREEGIELTCNLCGSHKIVPSGPEDNQCSDCFAWTRQRAAKIWLEHLSILKPGAKIMHLAPEQSLSEYISSRVGDGYEAFDINPSLYPFTNVKKLDLVADSERLPSNYYDAVIHTHVMEHISCNVTAVLYHLHRSLKKSGYHIMALPMMGGYYAEDLGPLSEEEATRRFGQFDHVRYFSCGDLPKTLGMIFKLPNYNLAAAASPEELDRAGIPPEYRRGFSGSTIFTFSKADLLLCDPSA